MVFAITALSLIRNRAVWLQHGGGTQTRVWTLWTATDKQPAPRLLARATLFVDLDPGCGGPVELRKRAGAATLDNDRFTFARGRRVTTEVLFQ
jgi:hypothetical protein